MASRILQRFLQNKTVCLSQTRQMKCIRTLLSEAYSCNRAWSERLNTPVLQNLDVSNYAIQIQDKMERDGSVSAIDMDLFANKLERMDVNQYDFAQNLLYKFRHTKATVEAQESMQHAVVKALLKHGETERLLNILHDKVHYGIFLDDYTANLLLDHFIESKKYKEAASIAIDQMLQEDFSHPITRWLSWYSCHLRIKSTPVTDMEVYPELPEDDDGEEEKWVKVNFIKNPWYDDHWDLHTESLRLGKTLAMLTEGEENVLGYSYHLMGLALWNKFPQAFEFLSAISKDETAKITKQSIEFLGSILQNVETQEPPEKKDPGLTRIKDVRPYITAEQKEEYLSTYEKVKSELTSQIVDEDVEVVLVEKVKTVIRAVEPTDIENLQQRYNTWNTERLQLLDKQIKEVSELKRRQEIAQRLRELQEKEEKLRYFELQNKVKVAKMKAPPEINIEEVVEEEVYVAPPGERGRNV